MIEPGIQTNWYVITGGPSSGKTTLINLLAQRGYQITIEHARHYIDTQQKNGRTIAEIKMNQEEFQRSVLQMQIDQESRLDPAHVVFLDRAIPDALAYYRFLHLPFHPLLTQNLRLFHYRKIFILDLLPLVQDYARQEDGDDQRTIHRLLIEAYRELYLEIIHVPVLPPEERVDFVLRNCR